MSTLKELNKATSINQYFINVDFCNIEETLTDYKVSNKLQLDPDFQRGHKWKEKQQVDFIKFIINDPRKTQTIHFNCPDWGNGDIVLVDGLQRLTAYRFFLSDNLKIYGKKFSEFEDHVLFARRYSVIFHVNNLQNKSEVLHWYLEMNRGGTPHTKKELGRVEDLLEKQLIEEGN